MNQKVYDALKRAGRPEHICQSVAKRAAKTQWRDAVMEIDTDSSEPPVSK